VCDVRFHQGARVECWSNARDHGTTHGLTLVEHVHAGIVRLRDRGSLRVAFCATLTTRGMWWISRDAHQVSADVSRICSHADGVLDAIVSLGTDPVNQANSPVRVIHFWLHGRHVRSLTTVLDSQVVPLADVVSLSARRWEIERAFRAITDHLTLHHLCLWSETWAVVHVHLWCCLILAQVSQGEIAGHTGVEVCEVSLDLLAVKRDEI